SLHRLRGSPEAARHGSAAAHLAHPYRQRAQDRLRRRESRRAGGNRRLAAAAQSGKRSARAAAAPRRTVGLVNANEGRGSVLIVATDRDDRRVLFDALDAQEFDAIYTAKDVAQARAFLEQDPQIDLVLLEFLDDARSALTFCGQLRQYHPGAPVPI